MIELSFKMSCVAHSINNIRFTELPKETPTLLHFAAYYDLKKLAKALLQCPGANEALSIKNCHGKGPVGVAQFRKNNEMEQLLQDHQVCVFMVWFKMAAWTVLRGRWFRLVYCMWDG